MGRAGRDFRAEGQTGGETAKPRSQGGEASNVVQAQFIVKGAGEHAIEVQEGSLSQFAGELVFALPDFELARGPVGRRGAFRVVGVTGRVGGRVHSDLDGSNAPVQNETGLKKVCGFLSKVALRVQSQSQKVSFCTGGEG